MAMVVVRREPSPAATSCHCGGTTCDIPGSVHPCTRPWTPTCPRRLRDAQGGCCKRRSGGAQRGADGCAAGERAPRRARRVNPLVLRASRTPPNPLSGERGRPGELRWRRRAEHEQAAPWPPHLVAVLPPLSSPAGWTGPRWGLWKCAELRDVPQKRAHKLLTPPARAQSLSARQVGEQGRGRLQRGHRGPQRPQELREVLRRQRSPERLGRGR